MDLDEAMTTRRSVRRFRSDPVDRAAVEELIAMAVTAPSASNRQPWRFFVVESQETRDRMAARVEAAVTRVSAHIPTAMEGAFRRYGDYFVRFRQAPVVVAVASRPLTVLSNLVDSELTEEDRETIAEMEGVSGVASAAMAVQNLLLQAHARGLGASCMTGPLMAARELEDLLGIPRTWNLTALVPIGYPDEVPESTGRKPADAVLRWVDGKDGSHGTS